MKKTLILLALIFFSLFFLTLHGQNTIIDTLYSIPELDGDISLSVYSDDSHVGFNVPIFSVGDGFDPFETDIPYSRFFFSFLPPIIPEGYILANATFNIYQLGCRGDGQEGVYPIFNFESGDVYPPCLIDHINYGETLELEDFDSATLHQEQTISSTSEAGWRSMDVLDWVQDDIENDRQYTQTRLRLFPDHDADWHIDSIIFYGGAASEGKPFITYVYEAEAGIAGDSDILESNVFNLVNYPNPFNPATEIRFQISDGSEQDVRIEIYNAKGEKIKTLDPYLSSNKQYIAVWNGKNYADKSVSSGIYFYKLKSGKTTIVRKMVLMK